MTLKIRYMSDLHLEFDAAKFLDTALRFTAEDIWQPATVLEDKDTVLVLAGDIWSGFGWMVRWFQRPSWIELIAAKFKAVVIVGGNHDYWETNIDVANQQLKNQLFIQDYPTNIHYLDNDRVIIEDVSFVGCTLWTDYWNSEVVKNYVSSAMTDYDMIKTVGDGIENRLVVSDIVNRNHASSAFLKDCFANRPTRKKLVCVTHHAPFVRSNQGYRNEMLLPAYCNRIFDNDEYLPDIWIHGHIHKSAHYVVDDSCTVLANPRGYAGTSAHGSSLKSGFNDQAALSI